MKKTKIFLSSGGLGNQLFILWHLFCLSYEKKYKILLNTLLHDLNYKKTPAYIFLEFYNFLIEKTNLKKPSTFLKFYNLIALFFTRLTKYKNTYNHKTIQKLAYSKESIYKINLRNTFHEFGYYQCFDKKNIKRIKEFKKIFWEFFKVDEYNQKLIKIFKNPTLDKNIKPIELAIHFRRGDYKNSEYKMLLLELDYFEEALKIISTNATNNNLFQVIIFSDSKKIEELNELIELLKNKLPIYSIYVDRSKAFNSFINMTKSQIFLLSNSTFSLWAAILSRDCENIYLPKKWHLNISTKDIGINYLKKIIPINVV